MIEARQAVRLAAARPEVEDDRATAGRAGVAEHAGDVVRARAALQTVQDQQERRSRGRRPRDPVEVDEVTVAGVDPLAPKRQAAKMQDLLSALDAYIADPAAQRDRLPQLRQRLDEALRKPDDDVARVMTISVPPVPQ